jgi:oligopeptidase A
MNPLLDFSGLPRYNEIQPAHVAPAIDQLIAANDALVERLAAETATPEWENFVSPLAEANERLSRSWNQVGHLNAVMNNPALRDAYNAALPKVATYGARLAQHQGIFRRFRELAASAGFATLSPARRRVVEQTLRDFRLGGAELDEEPRQRFMQLEEGLAANSAKFSDNLLDATNHFALWLHNEAQLRGLPADVIQAARAAAEQDGKAGWKFTLHAPSYLPFMQYAEERSLRETLYRAYVTRASELPPPGETEPARFDNGALMRDILRLRAEKARLLGYENFAAVSLVPKMAGSPGEVRGFLMDLAQRARGYAERDLAELKQFAARELGLNDPQAWDFPYVAEKLRLQRYAFSEQEVKQYLPETTVLPGMFALVERLYGIRIVACEAPRWHADVRSYRVVEKDGRDIGLFYVDLYARESKRGGAWMDGAVTRRKLSGGAIQLPVAYLVCNFSAPVGARPAYFTHDEVLTLFHEFGHGLHHLLTEQVELEVSGIAGVEWDAVELPSQFMENFAWEWEVLQDLTQHADSGAKLPRALFDKMLAAKNFQSGMMMLRQLELSLFDWNLHDGYDPNGRASIGDVLDATRRDVAVLTPPAYNRFGHGFSHIFAGGYAAGYYSYKWAEVLSADAYSMFEDAGTANAETGARFRREILASGGSRPALESFIAFRGRAPRVDALLRHNGMSGPA